MIGRIENWKLINEADGTVQVVRLSLAEAASAIVCNQLHTRAATRLCDRSFCVVPTPIDPRDEGGNAVKSESVHLQPRPTVSRVVRRAHFAACSATAIRFISARSLLVSPPPIDLPPWAAIALANRACWFGLR